MNAPVKNPPATFAEAFLKVQSSIKTAIKDTANGAFKGTKYADLGAVWDAVKNPLHDNGFTIIQSPDFEGGQGGDMWLKTTILHVSGEKMEGRYPLRPTKQDPQGYGSALTYARRYSISAMLGVIADDDDDGNAASAAPKQAQPAAPAQDQDVTDGVTNWVATQKAAIAKAASLPTLYAWLENIAGAGTAITDPDTGSVLDRLKRKSPEAYGVVVAAWNTRLQEINRKENNK
jgi:hypothetical protein